MNINNRPDDREFENELRSLEYFEPPLKFKSQTKERIKLETKWFSVEKRLNWIPKVCAIGLAGIFICLLVIMNQASLPSYNFNGNTDLFQFLATLLGIAFIQLIFLFDLFLKKRLVLGD